MINWYKYLPKPELLAQNYFKLSSWTNFHGINRLFVLAFEDAQRTTNKKYYVPNVEIKDYNVMIWWKKLFWSTSKK